VPTPPSEDDGCVVERAEAGSATSGAQPLGLYGGALAPAHVEKSVKATSFTPRVGPFEQVLVS
jgi:hypothetical protein